MAYDPVKAALFNKLRQDGLSEDAAYAQAGISGNDVYNYTVNETGSNDPNAANYNPNYGTLTYSGFSNPTAKNSTLSTSQTAADPEVAQQTFKETTTVTASLSSTTTTETVSGSGTETRTIQPTQRVDSSVTAELQSKADALAAQRNEVSAQLKSEGLTSAQIRQDPRYQDLNTQFLAAQNAADSSTLGVPGTGSTTTTSTPNTTATTTTVEGSSPNFLTQNAGSADPTVQNQEIAQTNSLVATNQVQTTAGSAAEDPFEAQRLEAEAAFNQEPTALTADDVGEEDPFEAMRLEQEQELNREALANELPDAEPVDPNSDPELAYYQQLQRENELAAVESSYPADVPSSGTGYTGTPYDDDGNLNPGWTLDEEGNPVYVGGGFVEPATAASAEASRTAALRNNAQLQNTLNDRVNIPASADWRVRLSLAPGATYLYMDDNPGILKPLKDTGGVIFPYTPQIESTYQAKYDSVDLTHSNYRGYFYKNSSIDAVNMRCTFTAQSTKEAQYLLAVIHFFRSVTKMFYGNGDPLAGTPPPLVFLSGLGQYQFNNNPCVVTSFTYNLPSDVDYIRANGFNNYGINLENRRDQSSGPPATGILGAVATVNRLLNNGLVKGALGALGVGGQPGAVPSNNSKTNYTNSTYVPTKIEISIGLLPVQTRSQVSTQFNMQKFASGSLLQGGGFW